MDQALDKIKMKGQITTTMSLVDKQGKDRKECVTSAKKCVRASCSLKGRERAAGLAL